MSRKSERERKHQLLKMRRYAESIKTEEELDRILAQQPNVAIRDGFLAFAAPFLRFKTKGTPPEPKAVD